MGIEILAPDVNTSLVLFGVVMEEESVARVRGQGQAREEERGGPNPSLNSQHSLDPRPSTLDAKAIGISFGLGAIKGVGEAAMRAIVEEREANGKFQNIFDLCERVDPKQLQKGVLETLIKAGALDSFGPNRAQHMLVIDRATQSAVNHHRDKARGQKSLFGGLDESAGATGEVDVTLPSAEDWTHSQKLAFEKETLGFYLTSHPLAEFADQLEAYAQQTISELHALEDRAEILVGGMVSSLKRATTKKASRNGNSNYLNFDLEDASGAVRCILWPDDYAREKDKMQPEAVVIVKGRIDTLRREPNLICNKVFTLAEAEKEFTRNVAIKLVRGYHTDDDMKRVRTVLSQFPGKTPVLLVIETWPEAPKAKEQPIPGLNGPPESPISLPDQMAAVNGDAANGHASNGHEETDHHLRAYVQTPIQVTVNTDLKRSLNEVLGSGNLRFQA